SVADQRMQARSQYIGMRLAEREAAPVWATVGAPAGLVTGQFERVGPANVLIRPAELDRHLSRHADNQWRAEQAGRVCLDQIGAMVVQQEGPGVRRWKPGIGTRSVDRLVPAMGERLLRQARGLPCNGDVDALAANHGAAAFKLIGELSEETGFLLGRCDGKLYGRARRGW